MGDVLTGPDAAQAIQAYTRLEGVRFDAARVAAAVRSAPDRFMLNVRLTQRERFSGLLRSRRSRTTRRAGRAVKAAQRPARPATQTPGRRPVTAVAV